MGKGAKRTPRLAKRRSILAASREIVVVLLVAVPSPSVRS